MFKRNISWIVTIWRCSSSFCCCFFRSAFLVSCCCLFFFLLLFVLVLSLLSSSSVVTPSSSFFSSSSLSPSTLIRNNSNFVVFGSTTTKIMIGWLSLLSLISTSAAGKSLTSLGDDPLALGFPISSPLPLGGGFVVATCRGGVDNAVVIHFFFLLLYLTLRRKLPHHLLRGKPFKERLRLVFCSLFEGMLHY